MFQDLLDDDKIQDNIPQEEAKDQEIDNFDPEILIPEDVLKPEGALELKKKTPDLFDKHIARIFKYRRVALPSHP
jgi:hypothetical protein